MQSTSITHNKIPSLQARVPWGLTWAIVWAVTKTFHPIVHQCLLNQCKGYWLLSYALFTTLVIMRMMKKEYARQVILVPQLQCGEFDQKIEILYSKMAAKIINVMCLFLGFVETFFQEKTNMMFTLMFDPCFKSMNCIMDHVGRDQATILVQQYDDLVMLAFLNNNVGFLCQVKLQHF